jgi:hypothetical protein
MKKESTAALAVSLAALDVASLEVVAGGAPSVRTEGSVRNEPSIVDGSGRPIESYYKQEPAPTPPPGEAPAATGWNSWSKTKKAGAIAAGTGALVFAGESFD